MDAAEIRTAIDGAAAAVQVGLQKMSDNNLRGRFVTGVSPQKKVKRSVDGSFDKR